MNVFVKVCLRKSWFNDKEAAERAAERIRANTSNPDNARMVAYRCPWAPHFHVGHLKKSKKEKSRTIPSGNSVPDV